MEFNRLRSALDLRKDKEPSINLFMSLIDILIKDIKDEAGTDIQSIDVGDEQTAIIATNVCRNINKICKSNMENFERGAELLKRQLKEIDSVQEELEKNSEKINTMMKDKQSAESVREKLESEKESLLNVKNEYDKVNRDVEKLQKEINELKEFNIDSKKEELNKLVKDKQSFATDNSDVQKKIAETADEVEALKKKNDLLNKEFEQLRLDYSREYDLKSESEMKLSELGKQYEVLVIGNADLEVKKGKAEEEFKKLEASVSALKADIEDYRIKEIEPMKSEEYRLTIQKEAYQNQKADMNNQLLSVSDEIKQIITEISVLNNSIDEEKKKLESKKFDIEERKLKINEYKNENEKLIKQYDALISELEAKQNFVAQTEEKMEEIISSKAKEDQRKSELEDKIAALQLEYERMVEGNALLQNDADKVSLEVKKCKDKRDALIKEKNAADSEIEQLNRLIAELSFVNNSGLYKNIENQKEKLELLKDVANNLKKTTSEIRSIVKAIPDETVSLENYLSDTINKLDDYLKTIGKSLVKCADAIKLEEKRI